MNIDIDIQPFIDNNRKYIKCSSPINTSELATLSINGVADILLDNTFISNDIIDITDFNINDLDSIIVIYEEL